MAPVSLTSRPVGPALSVGGRSPPQTRPASCLRLSPPPCPLALLSLGVSSFRTAEPLPGSRRGHTRGRCFRKRAPRGRSDAAGRLRSPSFPFARPRAHRGAAPAWLSPPGDAPDVPRSPSTRRAVTRSIRPSRPETGGLLGVPLRRSCPAGTVTAGRSGRLVARGRQGARGLWGDQSSPGRGLKPVPSRGTPAGLVVAPHHLLCSRLPPESACPVSHGHQDAGAHKAPLHISSPVPAAPALVDRTLSRTWTVPPDLAPREPGQRVSGR